MIKFLKNLITLDFLMCFLLVVASGNPIFIYSDHVRELYVGLAGLSVLYNWKKRADGMSKFSKYAAVFVIVMLLQQALIPDLSFSSQIFAVIRIFIGVMIIRGLGEKFVPEYIKVMTVVATISLVLYPISLRIGLLPSVQVTDSRYSMFLYTIINSEYGGILARNSGMFWEPGAFQGYLNIAIAFALLLPENKDRKWSLVLMIAALLTTVSTTGYLVFGFIIIFYVYKYSKLNSTLRTFCTIGVVGVCVYSFFTLEFLNDKIIENAQDTESAQGRFTDYIRYGYYLKNNFLFGINIESENVESGNGFVYMILYYGAIVVLYYFLSLWNYLRNIQSIALSMYFTGVILLTLQGETFMFYPLYLAFPLVVLKLSEPLCYNPHK